MTDCKGPKVIKDRNRPEFPKRAVITGGMPYGNKDLHFGHIGGVFVHADSFARFLKDRIGKDNVIFVSGTDCYGSPIVEEHRKLKAEGKVDKPLEEYVWQNHETQKQTLSAYNVNLSLFAASGYSPFKEIHEEIGAQILNTLYENGYLEKRSLPQFYEPEFDVFLNGRQVRGRCPVQGCQSETAYADECSLGHQYEPTELIDPKSTLTGNTPEMRDVTNWYIKMPEMRGVLADWMERIKASGQWRQMVLSSIGEHFEPPTIYVTMNQLDDLEKITDQLPQHTQEEGKAKSVNLVFNSVEEREKATEVLTKHSIRYRTGKTIVPFRMTGNLDWGLPAPVIESLEGLTFWVWPESLWAPVSFTAAYLEQTGRNKDDWKDWWCSKESQVYQFIGEDNIFFYSLPEMAMFFGMQGKEMTADPPEGEYQSPILIANRHLLFLDKKASSSGKVKPPMASDLLGYYTSDQLRTHFFSMGLSMRSTSFRPKPLNPTATEKEGDPVMKEGNLISNNFNRAIRSCFYTTQKFFDGIIPVGEISQDLIELSENTILDFEEAMYKHEFHRTVVIAGNYIREINKRWSQFKPYTDDCDAEVRKQALLDCFHMVRVAVCLTHSFAPEGSEMVCEYLQFGEEFWNWDNIFEPLYFFMDNPEEYKLKFLEPKMDFFTKHESQFAKS